MLQIESFKRKEQFNVLLLQRQLSGGIYSARRWSQDYNFVPTNSEFVHVFLNNFLTKIELFELRENDYPTKWIFCKTK